MVQDWEQPMPGSFLPPNATSRDTPPPPTAGEPNMASPEVVPLLLRGAEARARAAEAKPGATVTRYHAGPDAESAPKEQDTEHQQAIIDALITALARVLAHAVRDRIPVFMQDVMAARPAPAPIPSDPGSLVATPQESIAQDD